jgi:hypothetical protein
MVDMDLSLHPMKPEIIGNEFVYFKTRHNGESGASTVRMHGN